MAIYKRYITQKSKNNPNFKHGRYVVNYCYDCHCIVDPTAKRCKSCENKRRYKNIKKHPMYNKKCPKHSEEMKRENNPMWNNGSSKLPYSFEFTKELKKLIRKRDRGICKNCNMTEEEHLKLYNRVLNIPHIDYNKKTSIEDNLITLCNQCHMRTNFNRKYWKHYCRKVLCKR